MRRLVNLLRIALGGWLCVLALLVLFYPPAVAGFARTGYPAWMRWLLGGTECIGAALFIWPHTLFPGGWLLLASLLLAIGLHVGISAALGALPAYLAGVVSILWVEHKFIRRDHGA